MLGRINRLLQHVINGFEATVVICMAQSEIGTKDMDTRGRIATAIETKYYRNSRNLFELNSNK
jgi:hypothetical protein